MPLYEFCCTDCGVNYEEITKYDESEKYATVQCPSCGSDKKTKNPSLTSISFKDPTTSSKFDSFSYRAGYNMEKAQGERRFAEQFSDVGAEPYRRIDDTVHGEGVHDV